MRRFFGSVLLLLALLWVADFAVGSALARLYHASPGESGDWLGRAFAARAPIVVCGSSRVEHHYVVDSLSTELGVRAYNLGRPKSWGAMYQYGVSKMVLHHYVPRLWIMEVETGTYTYPERMEHLVSFVPYVREEPAAAELLERRSPWERIKRISRIYPYNSLLVGLLTPYVGTPPRLRDGFVALTGNLADDPNRSVPKGPVEPFGHPKPDSLKMHYLEATLAALRSHGTTVIAIRSPYWPPTPPDMANDLTAERNLREVFGKLGVRYFDFAARHVPVFADPALFSDDSHLNERGALVFTHALAESIRTLPNAEELLAPAKP